MKNKEIERKWLVDGFPDLPAMETLQTEQGYLYFEPTTVRVRRREGRDGNDYRLCLKSGGTLERTEVELPLDAEQYAALAALLATPTVQKDYRCYRLPSGHVLEVSHVDPGAPESFFYAEVEFATVEEARAFLPPPYLLREVTEEPGFTMAAYCRRKAGLV